MTFSHMVPKGVPELILELFGAHFGAILRYFEVCFLIRVLCLFVTFLIDCVESPHTF